MSFYLFSVLLHYLYLSLACLKSTAWKCHLHKIALSCVTADVICYVSFIISSLLSNLAVYRAGYCPIDWESEVPTV